MVSLMKHEWKKVPFFRPRQISKEKMLPFCKSLRCKRAKAVRAERAIYHFLVEMEAVMVPS